MTPARTMRLRIMVTPMVRRLGQDLHDAWTHNGGCQTPDVFDAEFNTIEEGRGGEDNPQNVYKKTKRTPLEERYTARVETWVASIALMSGIGEQHVRQHAEKALRDTRPRPRGDGFWDDFEARFWELVGR